MPELPDIATYKVHELRESSSLLYRMAGAYPGDMTGCMSKEAFILDIMADYIEHVIDWKEIMAKYKAEQPTIEVTYA